MHSSGPLDSYLTTASCQPLSDHCLTASDARHLSASAAINVSVLQQQIASYLDSAENQLNRTLNARTGGQYVADGMLSFHVII